MNEDASVCPKYADIIGSHSSILIGSECVKSYTVCHCIRMDKTYRTYLYRLYILICQKSIYTPAPENYQGRYVTFNILHMSAQIVLLSCLAPLQGRTENFPRG